MLRNLIAIFGLTLVSTLAVHAATTPARVLVVYNSNWAGDGDGDGVQDSLQVANYYVARRGVPAANMLGVACSTGQSGYYSTYASFYSEMVAPIKAKLATLGATNIDVLLLCYGVPGSVPNSSGQGVGLDNALMALNYWSASSDNIGWYGNPYFNANPTFGTNPGHFTHSSFKFGGTDMYMVSRLDGPNGVYGAMNLIDQAIYGERYISAQAGYYNGYAYIDTGYGQTGTNLPYTDAWLAADPDVQSGYYGTYAGVDKNIAFAQRFVNASGFTLRWQNNTDNTSHIIGDLGMTYSDGSSAVTAPRALFYGGWYSFARYNDVWEWLPGSIASDLNSDSYGVFGNGALARGCSAFCGVVGEPYTTGHPRSHILYYYILQGYNFAEASTLATPSIGWMPINIGDPLYTPLAAKTLVKDTQSPVLASGYPKVSGTSGSRTITVAVQTSPEPDAVKVQVQYGFTTAYGLTATSGQGYWRICTVPLNGLQGNSTYHYRLVMIDPVGNVTTTGDFTFTTGAVANTAPAAQSQSVILGHDTVKTISVTATDAEGNALTYSAVTPPAHGTLSISGSQTFGNATATYTPAAGYSGADSFTFKANDGAVDSNVATVSLTVMPTTEVTVVLQQGLNGYSGASDTNITSGSWTDYNFGGTATMATWGGGYRILSRFDVSSIPATATISSAKLELYLASTGWASPGQQIPLYRVTQPWVEGTSIYGTPADGATWNEFNYTDGVTTAAGNWITPGGDYDPTVQGTVSTSDVVYLNWIPWNISGLVQGWVNGSYPNNGAIILNTGGEYTFCTREYTADPTLRPKLTISYFSTSGSNHPPVITSAPTASPNPALVGQTVSFATAASDADGDTLTYTWNFGDSLGGSGASTTHVYASAGTYTATVTVNDGHGGTASATVGVVINNPTYTITASAGTGGTITPSGAVSVNSGANQSFTVAANSGYTIAGVTVDGSSVGAVSSYTFSNVTANHTIAATFNAIPTFTITASAGTGGTISPSGAVSVSSGGSKTFTIAANTGYTIAAVMVDGSSVGAVSSYTFSNVTANHTIAATFNAIPMFTITASAGAGGTISPSGAVSVNSGANQSFTIAANSGYMIAGVTVDGSPVGAVSSYTFSNVTANHTISATFNSTGSSTTVVLQDGLNGYSGTRDTFMYAGVGANTNYGSQNPLLSDASDTMLVRFNIFQSEGGPVPAGATIDSATVALYKSTFYNFTYNAQRVLKNWVELQATWNNANSTTAWSTPGASGSGTDIFATADGQGTVGWNPGWLSIDVTPGVQAFAFGSANYGWEFVNVSGNGNTMNYYSREYATDPTLRPSLTIVYHTGSVSAPVITSATNASGTVGTAFNYAITATNTPASYNATGLPAGLSVNTTTGVISGTPTMSGTSSVTISATNAGGTGSATLTLTINAASPPAPVITSATSASGTVGSAFSYAITATNTPTSYNATGLPAGLAVNTGSGVISGTPSASGTFTVTLSASNAGGTGTAMLTLTISAAPPAAVHVASIAMTVAKVGNGKTATATVTIVDGNGTPINGATVTGSWTGLTTGSASGTTGANGSVALTSAKSRQTGTFTFTVKGVSATGYAYDSSKNVVSSASISTSGVVSVSAPALADLSIIDLGSVGVNKTFKLKLPLPANLTASGRIKSKATGLPKGLRVGGDFVGGRAKQSGAVAFTVKFTQAVKGAAPIQATQQYILNVTP